MPWLKSVFPVPNLPTQLALNVVLNYVLYTFSDAKNVICRCALPAGKNWMGNVLFQSRVCQPVV